MRLGVAGVLERTVVAMCQHLRLRKPANAAGLKSEPHLRYRLLTCILSSQVSWEMAVAAANRMRMQGLLSQGSPTPEDLEPRVVESLLRPLRTNTGVRRYRFPNVRARQVAWTLVHLNTPQHRMFLSGLCSEKTNAAEARLRLVTAMYGVGPKQASMFLRDVGASNDLAIIDRHVLRYMCAVGMTSSPPPVASIGAYERVEATLRRYADRLGYSLGCLDTALWITMRAAREERLV